MQTPPAPTCPHCDEIVEERWDVCRNCGKAIRVAKPTIPHWAWAVGAVIFISAFVLGGKQLFKAGVGSCRGSNKPGCAQALESCDLVTKHQAALRGKGPAVPVSVVLDEAQRSFRLAELAREKGGVRFTALPVYTKKLVDVLSKPGAQLPLEKRDLLNYGYLIRTCEPIAPDN